MGIYKFLFIATEPYENEVGVAFNDLDRDTLPNVVAAFEQFLIGLTFQPGSIEKYINTVRVGIDLQDEAEHSDLL